MNDAEYSGSAPQGLPAQTGNAPLEYRGTQIAQRGEKLSLTDMWRAAGSELSRAPAEWLRSSDAERFIGFVADTLNMGISHDEIVKTVRGGKTPGTWAHWQIGLAYAKYLSPEFHVWCNQVVRDRMEGRALATAHGLSPYDISIIGNVVKNCTAVVLREQLGEMLPQMLTSAVASIGSIVAPGIPTPIVRQGRTAGQIWKAHGFPPLRATSWFGNRLTEMGCGIYGRGELGDNRARLFDPDKAADWINGGGRAMVDGYVKERLGQGKLEGV